MTDHLPECKAGYPPVQGQGGTGPAYTYPCICAALRACETRVLRDARVLDHTLDKAIWLAGVQAARDAVAALPMPPEVPFIHSDGQQVFVRFRDALAAIDALKGEQA